MRKDNKYFTIGLTVFLVIAACAVLIFVLFNLSDVISLLRDLLSILSSVLFGALFAYLMNPVVNIVEKFFLRFFQKRAAPDRVARKWSRVFGIIAALIVFLGIIAILIISIIPKITDSVKNILNPDTLSKNYNAFYNWANAAVTGTSLENWFHNNISGNSDTFVKTVSGWFKNIDFASVSSALSQVYNVLKLIFNAVIGIIVAVYMLASKDKLQSQSKKIIVATFKQKTADRLLEIAGRTNKILGGFLVGKIIDSIIIGVLCYIGILIINIFTNGAITQPELISVVFCITNIIPFFGPFIGIAFGTALLLLESLVSGASALPALYYVIFAVILQQIDGNIIGPRILGGRLGISDLWIIVSISVFGGIFGFGGMLLGVPVFTLIYSLISDAVANSVRKKNLPENTDVYYDIHSVDDLRYGFTVSDDSTVHYSGGSSNSEYEPDSEIEFVDDFDDNASESSNG